jgi:hypothetical protein
MNSPYLIDILFMNDKPKRGGTREGAGAPKKPETKVVPFRLRLNEIDHIRKVVKKEVAKLRKGKPKPPKNDYA